MKIFKKWIIEPNYNFKSNMANKIQPNMQWLYLNKNQINCIPVSKQTQSIRNKTNLKIRELGSKYYNVKRLFDKLNFHRDFLFTTGKELEQEFKNQKEGILLQSQCRRSKEALICWYSEFFYSELFTPNSNVLLKLVNDVNNTSVIKKKVNHNNDKASTQNDISINQVPINTEKTQEIQESLFLDGIIFNKEIDSFDYKIEKSNNDNDTSNQSFFDYDKLLNFNK